jgi:hypothetical protein
VKKALAWVMLVGSVAGLITSVWPLELFAKSEPKVVLALSWAALLFSSIDALFIEHSD